MDITLITQNTSQVDSSGAAQGASPQGTPNDGWVEYYVFFAFVDSLTTQQGSVEAYAKQIVETGNTVQRLIDIYTSIKYLRLPSNPTKSDIITTNIENQKITTEKDYWQGEISTTNQKGQIENTAVTSAVQEVTQIGSATASILQSLSTAMKYIINLGKK